MNFFRIVYETNITNRISNSQDFTRDQYDSGVLHSQRAVAEIVEMKRTGHMIHKTMVNLQEKEKHGDKYKDLLYGNKIVLLTG